MTTREVASSTPSKPASRHGIKKALKRKVPTLRERHQDGTPVEMGLVEPLVYTLDEFCSSHRISRSKLYMMIKAKKGPRFLKDVGDLKLISKEAAAQWRAEREGN